MKGSPVRVRASALSISRDFSSDFACRSPGICGGGVYQGSTAGGRAAFKDRFTDRDAPAGGIAHDVCVGARREAGVGVTEVLGDLVQRAAFVEEQRGAGVAEVIAAEVRNAGTLERGDPDAAAPVVPAQVAAQAVGEDERARSGLRQGVRGAHGHS